MPDLHEEVTVKIMGSHGSMQEHFYVGILSKREQLDLTDDIRDVVKKYKR